MYQIYCLVAFVIKAISTAKNCDYSCNSNGGCTVKYVGPFRPGALSGSCFPKSFGGSCSGTPPECSNCNQVIKCGGESSGGRPPIVGRPPIGGRPTIIGRPPSKGNLGGN